MKNLGLLNYLFIIFIAISCVGDPVENAEERTRLEAIRISNPSISSISSSLSNSTYTTGSNIDIVVNFTKDVTTSSSSLTLSNGETASYLSGSGSQSITYRYTVGSAGSEDSSDLDVSAFNAGDAIGTLLGKSLSTSLPSSNLAINKDIIIDTTAASISSIRLIDSETNTQFGPSDTVDIVVTFNDPITTATSSLTLNTTTTASYYSGTGTTEITYRYTVGATGSGENTTTLNVTAFNAGDAVNDVAIAAGTALPAGNNLSDNDTIEIDTTSPTLIAVTTRNTDETVKSAATYGLGEVFYIDLQFDDDISSTTSNLDLGGGKTGTYLSQPSSDTLRFSYTVAASDSASPLDISTFNHGDMTDDMGNVGVTTSTFTGINISDTATLNVSTTAATITNITSPLADGTYHYNYPENDIQIQVVFSDPVVTSTSSLTINSGSATATYVSGSGTNTITYEYDVTSSDNFPMDITAFNVGDAVTDINNSITTTLPGAPSLGTGQAKEIYIDTTSPSITEITSLTADGTYNSGPIQIQVEFNDNVVVDSGSTLTFFNGDTATYASGSGTNQIVYQYTTGNMNNSSPDLNVSSFNQGGATTVDDAGNALLNTIPVGDNLADNNAIVIDVTIPEIRRIEAPSPGDGSYMAGDVIQITLVFWENVSSSTSSITLDTGDVVAYSSGSSTNELVYNYTVPVATTSSDLEVTAFTVGDTADLIGNAAVSTLPAALNLDDTQDIEIDTTIPTISSIQAVGTADGAYTIGEVIDIHVNFDDEITTTTATLTLNSGATVNLHPTADGSGTQTVVFQYTVASPDDTSGANLNVTAFNLGDATDTAGNVLDNDLTAVNTANQNLEDLNAITIDAVLPTITNIAASTADGSYSTGSIYIDVDFSESITGTGSTSTLTLSNGEVASYDSEVDSDTLRYIYNISGNASEDTAGANLNVTAFTVGDTTDTTLNAVDGDLTTIDTGNVNLEDNSNIIIDTTDPTITNIAANTADGTYGPTTVILIDVDFSEDVTGNTSILNLSNSATAIWNSQVDGDTIRYAYTVGSSSEDTAVNLNVTSVNVGNAVDTAGNIVDVSLATIDATNFNLEENSAILIDTTGPSITNIDVTAATPAGTYGPGQAFVVEVTFDENVTTTTSSLTFNNGDTATTISGGSGTTTISYSFNSSNDSANIDLDVSSITFGDAVDDYGNAIQGAMPTGNNISDNTQILIDNTAPVVQSIALNDPANDDNQTLIPGDIIDLVVNFDENVTTSTMSLTLDNGVVLPAANIQSGNGTSSIVYRYTVGASETTADLDVTSITAGDAVNDVGIAFVGGAVSAATSVAANHAVVVDTDLPTITDINSSTADGTYKIGDTINIEVTFTEPVTSTGAAATLTLDTGGTATVSANQTSLGANDLRFEYTVGASDTTSATFDVTTAFAVNDIQDLNGNALTDTSLPAGNTLVNNNPNIDIDTDSPDITDINSSSGSGTYTLGNTINIEVTFDEIVQSAGTSTLTLSNGGTANYSSGAPGTVITYQYTVASGDNIVPLNVTAFNNPSNDAVDSIGNPASTTLASSTYISDNGTIITLDAQSPSITDITTATADGTYSVGDTVSITIQLDEAIASNANSTSLVLNSGGTAAYTSDTGTSITYTYTVASGQDTTDLAVSSVSIGTAADANGNTLSTSLPSTPTMPASSAIVIDTSGPTITSISSSSGDGTYNYSQVIVINVLFNETVTASDATLTLSNGATATYNSGTGSNTLVFNYTVGSDEDISNLDVSAFNPVSGVADVETNAASTSLPSSSNLANNNAIHISSGTPSITSVSPQGGSTLGGTSVTIDGANFSASSVVDFGGSACNITSATSGQIICTTTAYGSTANVNITITNTDSQNVVKTSGYLYSPPVSVDSVSQTTISTDGGDSITINGSGFDATAAIQFTDGTNTYSCTSPTITSTAITCTTAAAAAGVYDVEVSQLQQTATLSNGITYANGAILTWQVGAADPNPPNPADWGNAGANTTWTFTLENTGNSASSNVTLSITGTDATNWSIGSGDCSGQALAVNATCTVQIHYLWDYAGSGSHSATLNASATSGGTTTNSLEGTKP